MPNITTRQYRILSDHMDIYRFMVELYERDWRNGVPAPFLEYALSCTWMDKSRTYQNRIWLVRYRGLLLHGGPGDRRLFQPPPRVRVFGPGDGRLCHRAYAR